MNTAPFSRCVECDEIISNPLCSECLAERMRMVVQVERPDLAAEINGFRIEGDTTCISCGKGMGLCAHCFSKGIYEFLQENDSSLAKEFANQFDFNLRTLADFE